MYVCNQFFFQISILVDLFVFQIPLLRYKSIFFLYFAYLFNTYIHIHIFFSQNHMLIWQLKERKTENHMKNEIIIYSQNQIEKSSLSYGKQRQVIR